MPSAIAATRRGATKRDQQADVTFADPLVPSNLREGGGATEPEVIDPVSGLGDGAQQSVAALGFHGGFATGSCTMARRRRCDRVILPAQDRDGRPERAEVG